MKLKIEGVTVAANLVAAMKTSMQVKALKFRIKYKNNHQLYLYIGYYMNAFGDGW